MSGKMRIEQLKQTTHKGNEEMNTNSEGLLEQRERVRSFTTEHGSTERKEKMQRFNRKLGDLGEKKTSSDVGSHHEHRAKPW